MLHVGLIEDNAADVLLVREALRVCAIPADVTIAYDGEDGLRMLTQEGRRFDFVILDLQLPKVTGLKILEHYNREQGPPVVVFTGSDDKTIHQRAIELGARECVTKPLGFNAFVKAVQNIVERFSIGKLLGY
jgi:CheY-like chemotaxis protein